MAIMYALYQPDYPQRPYNPDSLKESQEEVWNWFLGPYQPPHPSRNIKMKPRKEVIDQCLQDGYRIIKLEVLIQDS